MQQVQQVGGLQARDRALRGGSGRAGGDWSSRTKSEGEGRAGAKHARGRAKSVERDGDGDDRVLGVYIQYAYGATLSHRQAVLRDRRKAVI